MNKLKEEPNLGIKVSRKTLRKQEEVSSYLKKVVDPVPELSARSPSYCSFHYRNVKKNSNEKMAKTV